MKKEVKEIWKKIDGYSDFEISNLSNIFNVITGNPRQKQIKNGYEYIRLIGNNKKEKSLRVHRLVAKAFIDNDDPVNKKQVNHKDGNKLNNIVDNLEWITSPDNKKHAVETGLLETQARIVLQCDEDGKTIKEFPSIIEASKETGIDDGSICKVCKENGVNQTAGGFIWKYKDPTILAKEDKPAGMKEIKSHPKFSISRTGKVYNNKKERFMKQSDIDGYARVHLTHKKKRSGLLVHRLVAETFIKNPENKPLVIHKNKNKNDNRVENLRWATEKEKY
ncbi:MAG: HNH endonuclease [Edafosvirus sp.]|uniref:HNH endonuclease n=1 Tax=Edafosvirus sp. TaxID=2487765 RepID=A0A3G4ZXH2_9VIRU|nr:MAG: HNH endonuclease [Edafosvirus sp.]